MRHTLIVTTAALLTLGATTAAIAQSTGYTGPSSTTQTAPGAYTGPSSVPLMTVQQLLDTGNDDQHARLQGRIVSHDGGDHYTFEDATGQITIEIDDEDFPTGQSIGADTQVELLGEFDKGLRKTEFEVDRVTLIP